MSSKSFPDDLLAWLATRLLLPRIFVLWLVLTACMVAVSAPGRVLAAALLAALLITQFRLWDDLADRAHDARHHRGRVLTGSVHGSQFGLLCSCLALPVLAVGRPLPYLLLCVATALVYLIGRDWPRLVKSHVVLLKYPVFIAIASSGAALRPVIALGAGLWLLLAAQELFSDRTLQSGKYWRAVAGAECLGLCVLLALGLGFSHEFI